MSNSFVVGYVRRLLQFLLASKELRLAVGFRRESAQVGFYPVREGG